LEEDTVDLDFVDYRYSEALEEAGTQDHHVHCIGWAEAVSDTHYCRRDSVWNCLEFPLDLLPHIVVAVAVAVTGSCLQ
jgi:hypothetical protein